MREKKSETGGGRGGNKARNFGGVRRKGVRCKVVQTQNHTTTRTTIINKHTAKHTPTQTLTPTHSKTHTNTQQHRHPHQHQHQQSTPTPTTTQHNTTKMDWPKLDWPKSATTPEGGPEGCGGPKISRRKSRSFLPSLGVFSVEFWWRLKRRGPQMCTFGVLWLFCEAPAPESPNVDI